MGGIYVDKVYSTIRTPSAVHEKNWYNVGKFNVQLPNNYIAVCNVLFVATQFRISHDLCSSTA